MPRKSAQVNVADLMDAFKQSIEQQQKKKPQAKSPRQKNESEKRRRGWLMPDFELQHDQPRVVGKGGPYAPLLNNDQENAPRPSELL